MALNQNCRKSASGLAEMVAALAPGAGGISGDRVMLRVEFTGSYWTKFRGAELRNCEVLGEQGQMLASQLLDEIEHLLTRIDQVSRVWRCRPKMSSARRND